jgi:hypothetical protein
MSHHDYRPRVKKKERRREKCGEESDRDAERKVRRKKEKEEGRRGKRGEEGEKKKRDMKKKRGENEETEKIDCLNIPSIIPHTHNQLNQITFAQQQQPNQAISLHP